MTVSVVAKVVGAGTFDPANVALTGGSIDNTVIGATTPAAATFTQITGGTGATLAIIAGSGQGIQLSGTLVQTGSNTALKVQGSLTSTSATGGIGYGTGSGGTVTQATSKSTGVALNAANGQITLNNASLAAGAAVSFTLTSTAIAAPDLVLLNHISAGTAGAYSFCSTPAAGSTVITVRNLTAGALAEAIVVQYAVFKGVTA